MIIEIRKAGFVNKGAELMLHAAWLRMQREYPEAMFAMAPVYAGKNAGPFWGYAKRAEMGMLQKACLWRHGLQWGNLAALVPTRLRHMYGVVLDREMDVVLDAAGFAYGDQWGHRPAMELARACRRWQQNGTKIILLPQALGPFTSQKIKKAMQTVADHADLIFAREPVSYEHLVKTVGERPNIKMAPDFTNLLNGIVPDYFTIHPSRFCLVPNYRMIDKTSREHSEAYVPFMIKCAKLLQGKGATPFILVHEGADDFLLAQKISKACGGGLEIITESNPLMIKGILGACQGTVGSRFHGLVSALSQGVPSLATGWSHKYRMLLEDYDFGEGLLNIMATDDEIWRKINLIVDQDSRQRIHTTLLKKSVLLKQLSERVWQNVFEVIRGGNQAIT